MFFLVYLEPTKTTTTTPTARPPLPSSCRASGSLWTPQRPKKRQSHRTGGNSLPTPRKTAFPSPPVRLVAMGRTSTKTWMGSEFFGTFLKCLLGLFQLVIACVFLQPPYLTYNNTPNANNRRTVFLLVFHSCSALSHTLPLPASKS